MAEGCARRSTRRGSNRPRFPMPDAMRRPAPGFASTSFASCASAAGPRPHEPPVEALVERLAALNYVDDRAFAAARGAALGRRGYGARRVGEALRAAGIGEEDGAEARAAARDGAWAAALRFAERKKSGPFAGRRERPRGPRKGVRRDAPRRPSAPLARRILAAKARRNPGCGRAMNRHGSQSRNTW
jgi:hypothetical protein